MGEILHQIGIRWQLVLTQLIGFLLVFAVLRHFLFGRVQRVLDDRAADEVRRRSGIAAAEKQAAAAKATLQARHAEIEKQAYEKTQAEVRNGLARKSELVNAAIDTARAEVTAGREKVAVQRSEALARLEKDVASLTLFLAGKLVGRKLEAAGPVTAAAEREVAAVLAAHKGGSKS